jgi:hypothetical protein
MLQSNQDTESCGDPMSTLYDLVNVFNPQGEWLGEFINEEVAKDWLKKKELDVSKYEISKRRPEIKRNR